MKRLPRGSAPPLTFTGWLRYHLVAELVERAEAVERVLEIGAGVGSFGARLARAGYDYVGLEPDPTSFERARRRLAGKGRVLCGGIDALDGAPAFDMICAFEVLEHIEDDRAALSGWVERLRPDGHVLVSVPAWRARFGPADTMVGHYRRYDRSDLIELLEHVGLRIERLYVYGFPIGFPLESIRNELARRALARRKDGSTIEETGGGSRWLQPPEWAGVVSRFASAPFRRMQMPFRDTDLGVGYVVHARKPR